MKQQLGHYDLVAELGRGGMGVVYKGYEAPLNRYVAIKVLADSLAHDAAVKERFLREARSMAALNDPHIIQIYFIGEDEGQTFFVMEFVDGESLGSVLKREQRLKPEQAAKIVYQTALGLATAHDRGVIHRDIKPGNIMIDSRGNVKIADFGIALSSSDFSKKLTSTGEFVGTPGYLSPEVCLGKLVDQRSDIFSLGIVLFEMLAGRMPFTDESPLGLMLEVVKAEIPDVRGLNADVDPELSRILSRMIAKDPADRYQSCQDLAADLARHPLLAHGATLQLRTQPSAAAATVLGMKTPVSGQSPLPNTMPTPRPLPNAAATRLTPPRPQNTLPAISAVEADSGAHQSLLERQAAAAKKAKSPAVPLAIAALVLLGLAGGVFAYRDQLGFVKQWLPSGVLGPAAATTQASTAASAPAPSGSASAATVTANAAPPPAPATAAQAPAAAPSAPVEPPSTPAATAAANATAGAEKTSNPAGVAGGASVAELTAGSAASTDPSASAGAASAPASPTTTAQPAAQAVPPPAPPAAPQIAPVAPPTPSAEKQIAKIAPPPPVAPPKPHVPTVAVLSGGDIAVSEPAGRAIEHALARRGYRLADADMMPGAGRYLAGQRVDMPALLEFLARNGRVDAVVVVHARPTGAQNLPAYGMNVDATTAQLNVTTYAVQGRRKLGGGWSANVIYTGLSAQQQGEDAVEDIAPQVESSLVEYRPERGR